MMRGTTRGTGTGVRGGLVAAWALAVLAAPAAAQRGDLLVDADWLAAHRSDPGMVILHLGRNFATAHVPGAVPIDQGALAESRGEMDEPGHVMLDLPADLGPVRAAFEAAGVSDGSTVVVVFEGRGVANATRVLWTLEALGMGSAGRLLDGGMEAWTAAGHEVAAGAAPTPARGRITATPRLDRRVDLAFVRDHGQDPGIALLDARTAASYDGIEEESEGRAGHIPGARNLHFFDLVDERFRFKPEGELRDLFAAAGVSPGDRVVVYCHIGLWGSGVVYAARTLGYDAVLYDGSMSEWAQDRSLPLVKAAPGGR